MNDWCGEHVAVQQVEPAIMNSPIYNILTDTITAPKKRGRKPKNDQTIA
jgi:hypothetical protein